MKTTVRAFAEKNNLALPRLRRLLKKYDGVKIAHTSKGVNYYDEESLDLWLVGNKKHFSETATYQHLGNGETFYCMRNSHYAPISNATKKPGVCSECEKIPLTLTEKPASTRGKVPVEVLAHKLRMDKMTMARELKELNDVNGWMY